MLWLATTVALAVAVPAAWAQRNLVDENGYAVLAQKAAGDPALQSAMAGELTTRAMALIAEHGGGRYPVDSSQVRDAAAAFTAGPSFPPLFAAANRAAHRWLFADATVRRLLGGRPRPDAQRQCVSTDPERYNVKVPADADRPADGVGPPHSLRQGELSRVATWGSLGESGRRSPVRCVGTADAACRPAPRQGADQSGGLGAAGRRGRVGGHRGRQAATSTTGSTAPPAISARSRTSWCTTPRPACANGWT